MIDKISEIFSSISDYKATMTILVVVILFIVYKIACGIASMKRKVELQNITKTLDGRNIGINCTDNSIELRIMK